MITSRDVVLAVARDPTLNGRFGRGPRGNKPYFFIPSPPRNERGIRHCKIYDTPKLLDYTVHGTKEFRTLEAWAEDCGSTIDSVRYGFESPLPEFRSMTFREVQIFFFPPPPVIMSGMHRECDKLADSLLRLNLGFESVYVIHNNRLKTPDMLVDA